MIYLLEGRDGTGKTTLAERMSLRFNANILKVDSTYSHHDWRDDFVAIQALIASGSTNNIIYDRCILSGLAYSHTDTREDARRLLWEWLGQLHWHFDITLVHLTAPWGARWERDPDGSNVVLNHDLDELCMDARDHVEQAYQFDTSLLCTGEMVELIGNGLPVSNVSMEVFDNGWVKIVWSKHNKHVIPKYLWATAFSNLKTKWGVVDRKARHPGGFWMIHPNAMVSAGSTEQICNDLILEYERVGYRINIASMKYHPREWHENGELI